MKIPNIRKWCKENLLFFGPGLLLAITAAGEAGITEALEIGAHFGLSLAWVVIITLLFKYAFTTGIARYTLATGKTIFEGISELPGPFNWGSIFIIIIYLIETLSVGAMVLFTVTFTEYLLPGSYETILFAIIIIVLALLVLRTHIYHHFELVMAFFVLILAGLVFSFLIGFPMMGENLLNGIIPSINGVPKGSEESILAIIGVVGSGLNLMLYSVWMEKKIRVMRESSPEKAEYIKSESFFNKFIKSVRHDILIGFIIVAIITIGFMTLGYAGFSISFMPHGSELTLDCLLGQVGHIFNAVPGIIYLFLGFVTLIFFGSITVGLDARATAITKVVKLIRKKEGKPVKNASLVYNVCMIIFIVMMFIAVLINQPMQTIRFISVLCALLFGVVGFMLLYLNSKLPTYAKGNRFWILFIGLGSVLSIYFGLVLEGSILEFGMPLVKEMLLCLLVVYLFTKSKMFQRIVDGKGTLADKFWLIFICGAMSIYGTIGGQPMEGGYIINFRDFGAMAAGLLGGPVVGVIAGLIGGIYRLNLGGATAVPCLLSTVFAGLLAGIAIRKWQGKFTAKRIILLVCAVEILHIVVIAPTYCMAFNTMALPDIINMILTVLFPMILVNAAGLLLSMYFTHNRVDIHKGGLQKKSIKECWNEIKLLFKKGGDLQ